MSSSTDQQQQQGHSTTESPTTKKRLWYDATITSLETLTPTVTGVSLDVDIHRPVLTRDYGRTWEEYKPPAEMSFAAGQWVDFYIPPLNKVGGYSITSLPRHLPRLELAVKRSRHPPAEWVTTKSKAGVAVKVRVGGEFVYDTSAFDSNSGGLLFVAGGLGINPLYGMLRQLHSDIKEKEASPSDKRQRAVLLYSASTANELLFEPELSSMAAEYPSNFRMIYHVTKESSIGEYRMGRISSKEIGDALQWAAGSTCSESLSEGEHVSSVYICGPTKMAEDITDICCEQGVPNSNIHFEKWW